MSYDRLAQAISDWMRSYLRTTGLRGFVVGLSGGIDSAVTAALAVEAVGADNTRGILMPCHSQPEDARYAKLLADELGIRTQTIDLTSVCNMLEGILPPGPALARANLRPRLRMTVLYYVAQSNDCLVAGTGNKPEMMVGYFTKYGDGGVDIEPLGALYKHEVRELAKVLGVPQPIIDRPPTAGLWPGQTDEGEMGVTYDELDAVLDAMETGSRPVVSDEVIARVERMMAASAHKRALPPVFPIDRSGRRSW